MKTISVKYLGATNVRGSRLKASDGDNSITIGYPHGVGGMGADLDTYAVAAKALCAKLGWTGKMAAGHTKDGAVFVFIGKQGDYGCYEMGS